MRDRRIQLGQARDWLFRNQRGLALLLVLLWAFELFLVQEATLHEHHYYAAYQPFLHRAARAVLTLLTCGILVTILPRVALALFFVGGLVFSGVVLSFENYSGAPLSATMLSSTAGEGASVTDAGFAMLPDLFFVLLATLAVKFLILHRLRHRSPPPLRKRWARVARLAGSYVVLVALLNLYKPFTLLLGWETVGGIGSLYGYAPTWTAELLLLDNEKILARAIERGNARSDLLGTGVEADFPASDRVVFLQVESLDAAALTHEVDGRPVTPELRKLAATSMSYTIRSEKKTGSCDADFTALMRSLPSADMPNYKIPGFPYDRSLVKELQSWGYSTSAIHNVQGAFFNRRNAFEKIDFDDLYFLEELRSKEGLPFGDWAILDHDMLNWAADRIAGAEGKQFSLVITATSHVPFTYTPPGFREFFKGNDELVPSYLDSIHYVDEAIGDFVRALPKDTLLVIYGDHGAFVSSQEHGYQNLEYEGVALVPFLIHQVGRDIHGLQRTRDTELAHSGRLTLLDMMSYVHDVMRRHNEKQVLKSATPVSTH